MGKGGRKRQPGARYKSGKLKPIDKRGNSTKPTVEPMSGVLWQRIRQHGKAMAIDNRLVSELGRLNLSGELTIAQTVAGHRIAEIYGRFERSSGVRRTAKSPSYNASYGEAGIHDDLMTAEQIRVRDQREEEARAGFLELWDEMTRLPRRISDAVERICVEDGNVSPALYEEVRRFLDRMAVKWGITNVKKPGGANPAARATRTTAQTHVSDQQAEPAQPKPNVERIAWFQAIRALCPGMAGEQIKEAYDYYRALKDKTAQRFKVDRKRAKDGRPPLYEPASAGTAGKPLDRPVLTLPTQTEETTDA